MPNPSPFVFGQLLGGNGTAGQCVVFNGVNWVLYGSASRGSLTGCAIGILLTTTMAGGTAPIQVSGHVQPDVFNLGHGTAGLIYAGGFPTRTASVDTIGSCDSNGVLTIQQAYIGVYLGNQTGPQGPQGIQGPQGPTGSGTSIATATSIGTTGSVPNFGGSPGIIREDLDMSASSQITRTLPAAANFPAGSIYVAKMVNRATTSQLQPIIFTGTIAMEDPENPGTLATTVKCAVLGDCIWWQRNVDTGLQIIARALSAQIPQ